MLSRRLGTLLFVLAAIGLPDNRRHTAVAGPDGPAGAAVRTPRTPIDDARILRKETTITARLGDVWDAWTTSQGIASFFFPAANIEMRPGGAYELFDPAAPPDVNGLRGTEGCMLLSFIPKRMLSFEWSFPPKIPSLREAGAKTFVVLQFDDLGGRVRVRFAQLGWGSGDDWDAGYEYFDRAWDVVFARLAERFRDNGRTGTRTGSAETAPADRPAEGAKTRRWKDGHVTVIATDGPPKRQEFELTIPTSVEDVWKALTTTEGHRRHLSPQAEIELKPGGRYAVWPGATNRVLSYVPMEMLSTTGSAPPEFPSVLKGGTWSAYFFETADDGGTRLRLSVEGWQQGGEWDRAFEYFLKKNATFLNALRDKLAGDGADRPSP